MFLWLWSVAIAPPSTLMLYRLSRWNGNDEVVETDLDWP